MTPEQTSNLWQQMVATMPNAIPMPLEKGFSETWMKAFQQFQNMDIGASGLQAPPIDTPPLRFSP